MNEKLIKIIKFNKDGLVPAIAQQHNTGEVLMLAWMNKDSIQQTLTTNQVCYWSRSRQKLWRKGETSGNTQRLIEFRYDCDEDTILLMVDQTGSACHTGRRNCFYRVAKNESGEIETTLTEKKNIIPKSKFDTNSNKKLNSTAIREEDVLSIQKEWADSIISIGKMTRDLGTYSPCRFSRSTAYERAADLGVFDLSHTSRTGICLTKRFISYSPPNDAGCSLDVHHWPPGLRRRRRVLPRCQHPELPLPCPWHHGPGSACAW